MNVIWWLIGIGATGCLLWLLYIAIRIGETVGPVAQVGW